MLISLQEASSFLSDHHVVFDELWRHREDVLTEADILSIISASKAQATPGHLFAQLKKLRFLVEADAHAGAWELAPPFARWVEHLQQMARPVSSAVINGHLTALEQFLAAFKAASIKGDWVEGREILGDTRRGFQQLTENLGQTRAAIAKVVSEVKSEHRAQGAVERFRRINKLWKEHLMPMLELLDPAGNLEVICSGWERQLALSLEQGFLPDLRVAERIEREMQVLRVALRQSFRECRNELEPLHASLRRDSQWAEGAARILAQIEREGTAGSVLATSMPLSSFRFVSQISSAALEASAARWRDISEPPGVIDFGATSTPADSQALENILADIDAMPTDRFPVDDLLGFLAREHGTRGFHPVLQVFSLLVTDSRFIASFRQPIGEYPLADGVVRCGRVKLELRPTS